MGSKEWGKLERPGWLEGNTVETKDGEVWNILRFNSLPLWDKAAIVRVHDNGKTITFDPESGFIDFPGGMTKFTIRFDPTTGLYLTLSNNNPNPSQPSRAHRAVVAHLRRPAPLGSQTHAVRRRSGLTYEQSVQLTGFQYVDWQFDGGDILYIVRTAYDGAHNYHDANRITFHQIRDFGVCCSLG